MMKLHSIVAAGGAVLLGVPVAVAGQDELATLRAALASTDHSLGILHELAADLKGGAPARRDVVLDATEPPILDGQRRDQRLSELRDQVSLLTTQLDEAEAQRSPELYVAAAGDRVVYGFDDDVRRALRSLGLASSAPTAAKKPTKPVAEPEVTPAPTTPADQDRPAYSADPLGQARALFHAQKYDRAVAVLAPLTEDARALYWHGRSLEKLGRFDDALASLVRARELAEDELLKKLVDTDIEFVTWRKSFGHLGRNSK